MSAPILILELTGAAFGVLGTVLLALNGPRAGWGFVAYLASNAAWIGFAWIHGHWGLLAQQVAFTASSLLGAWVWLLKPLQQDRYAAVRWWLHGLADSVFELGLKVEHVDARLTTLVSNAIDQLALKIYLATESETKEGGKP